MQRHSIISACQSSNSGTSRRLAINALAAAAAASQQRHFAAKAWWPKSLGGNGPGPTDVPEPGNIFARILKGDAPATVVDNDDEELFTFRDKRPASTLHLLVIPRRFIRDASMLRGADDAELVARMESKARALIRAEVGDAFDESELSLGFHWPPWYSVPWLHLHAIYPRSAVTRWYKYTPFSYKSPAWVRRRASQYK